MPLILVFSYFISSTLLVNDDATVRLLYWILTSWVCIWLLIVGLSDPGIVPYYPKPPPGSASWPYSHQSGSYRPLKALFSKECNVIVEEYDHTCPWTGTAIGRKNMKSFRIFLVSIAMLLIVDVVLAVYRFSARSPAVLVFGVLIVAFIGMGLWCCMSSTAHHTSPSTAASMQVNYGAVPTIDKVVETRLEQDASELI
jgi:palmitoyltransferase ZDHHC9/14/18